MTINRADEMRRILIAGELAQSPEQQESAVAIESSLPDDATLPRNNTILDRADAALNARHDEVQGDRADFVKALEHLNAHAEPALAKLSQGGTTVLTPDESAALEAVIIADGTRPSFLLNDGKPALDDPFLGAWASTVTDHLAAMQKIARAVGRVQPRGGHASRFIGTATLIDRNNGLVLTNFHVIDDARVKHGIAMTRTGRSITIEGELEIDFVGEANSLASNRFKVTSVELPENFGRGHGVIDAAVARIEPVDSASTLADEVPLFSSAASLANGALSSLATIGFPGPPPRTMGQSGSVDWEFVTNTLFDKKFGLKRLAPGSFTSARGSHPDDAHQTAFGHNATTFGGASGSPVISWTDQGAPVFGLHFAGQTEESNYALSAAAAEAALTAIGVRFG